MGPHEFLSIISIIIYQFGTDNSLAMLFNNYVFYAIKCELNMTHLKLQGRSLKNDLRINECPYSSFSQTFFKWGPLSLVRMFYGPPYSWDYQTH